jgi:zinc protease
MMRALLALLVAAACGGAQPQATVPAPPAPAVAQVGSASSANAIPPPRSVVPAKATRVRSVDGITEYRLPNGLQILMFPDATQSTITVNITYLVGSRHEGYGETGMAHLLEHMMFKGSPRFRNVLALLEKRGGQANGTTWLDRTNYYETLPASQVNLDWTLDLEADRMRHAAISSEDLSSEFSVVRNELEAGENDPAQVLEERVVSTAYLWHNYGKSTIGSRADIERVSVSALRAFYEIYYQPDNAVLVVSGRFDDAAALASIERVFGPIAKPARTLRSTYSVEPVQDGERAVELRRTGDVHVVGLAYHTVAGTSDDYPAVEAALDILTREPSGRLYKKLVETKLAASIDGSTLATHDPYLGGLSAQVRNGKNVAKVQQIMIDEIERLGTTKIDEAALKRWRIATLKDIELSFADSQSLAIELSEYAALGDWRTLFAYRARVEKITVADVARVAGAYFKASNRTVGRFIPTAKPERAPLTEAPDIATVVKGIEGGGPADAGEAFVATLDNIEQRTKRVELAGGISAALLPKKARRGRVELELDLHWGDEKSLKDKAVIASFLGSLMARGTTKRSYQELRDREDELKARISISTSSSGLTLSIEALRDNFPAAIDLAFEMLQQPSFPSKDFEILKEEKLAALEEQLQDPQVLAWRTLNMLTSSWPLGDPRRQLSLPEQMDLVRRVSIGQVKQFYKDFVGAGHGELAVVGDFDPAAITAQLEKHVTRWQTKKPYARLDDKLWNMPATAKDIDTKDKENATIVMSHEIAMQDTDPDYAAWQMVSQILGGGLGSRIWTRLREKEGLSYGAGSWADADSFVAVGYIGASAIVAASNIAKGRTSLLDEVTRMATSPVTQDELRHAKDSWIKDQDTNLSSDSYLVDMLTSQAYRKRTTAYSKDLRARIEALTPADIQRVAAKYLDPKRLIIVTAGDLAKQKP